MKRVVTIEIGMCIPRPVGAYSITSALTTIVGAGSARRVVEARTKSAATTKPVALIITVINTRAVT